MVEEYKSLKPLKIAIFEPYYKFWGGAQVSALALGEALREKGMDVIFLSPDEGITPMRIRKRGFPCIICKQGKALDVFKEEVYKLNFLSLPWLFLSLLLFNLRLSYLLKREKVDVVILNTGRGTFMGALAGRIARIPSIAFLQGVLSDFRGWKEKVLRKFVLCLPNAIVCVSYSLLKSLKIPPSKPCEVVYNWLFFDAQEGRYEGKKLTRGENKFLIGFLGNLEPHKGLHILISALGKVDEKLRGGDWELRVGGEVTDPRYKESLEGLLKRLEIGEKVKFLGWVEDVPGFLRELDLFVLPSFTEGLPRAVMEAMAEGVVVIGSNVGGIPEVIGDAGVLVPPGDVDALACAILHLAEDEERRRRLGEMGRGRVRKVFNKEVQFGKLMKVIGMVKKGRGR